MDATTAKQIGNNSANKAANKAFKFFSLTISAGQGYPLSFSGNNFYVVYTSAPVGIQPVSQTSQGVKNPYQTQQGIFSGFTEFQILQLSNDNAVDLNCIIWVGWDDFRSDQVSLVNQLIQTAINPTYPQPLAANTISVPDLSGQSFTDVNGIKWFAIQRQAILCFNLDSSSNFRLMGAAASTSTGNAVGLVPAAPSGGSIPILFPYSGSYKFVSGAAINMIVSESYLAVVANNFITVA